MPNLALSRLRFFVTSMVMFVTPLSICTEQSLFSAIGWLQTNLRSISFVNSADAHFEVLRQFDNL
jgi:hypothetical protein